MVVGASSKTSDTNAVYTKEKQHIKNCINAVLPKKNSTLRTVFDLRQQNENTWKDVTPFPDQDAICHDIA